MPSSQHTRPNALLALAAVCLLWGTTWGVNKAFKTGAPIEQPEAEGI